MVSGVHRDCLIGGRLAFGHRCHLLAAGHLGSGPLVKNGPVQAAIV